VFEGEGERGRWKDGKRVKISTSSFFPRTSDFFLLPSDFISLI